MLLAAFIIAFLITKTIQEAKTDRVLAEKGIVSPRLQAKYGDAAKAKTDRYGLVDYLRDAWSDNWARRTELRRAGVDAAREAEPAPGRSRGSWADRWRAARRAVAAAAERVAPLARKLVDPVPERRDRQDPPPIGPVADEAPPPAGTAPRCPDCGDPLSRTGTGWDHPHGPSCGVTGRPYRRSSSGPSPASTQPCPLPGPHASHEYLSIGGSRNVCPGVLKPEGVEPMPAPTGEAVNYETTVTELEAIEREQMKHVDQAAACKQAISDAKVAIDGMQESYNATAAAAQSVNEHLGALLPGDTETLAQVGTVGDAMPPNKVNDMYDQLEHIETEAEQQKKNAEVALAATRAALSRVVAEYGEDAAKVADRMRGDPSFLASNAA